MKKLFTERHGAAKPRTSEVLGEAVRDALLALVSARVEEEWFGKAYPLGCSDGYPHAGTDISKLRATVKGYGLKFPGLYERPTRSWREPDHDEPSQPTDAEVFDLIEFSYEMIAEPEAREFHSFMGHTHYTYDQESGRDKFTVEVNRIFERNGIAFELKDGEVTRLAPAPLHEALESAHFQTGDRTLDVNRTGIAGGSNT